MYGLPLKGLGLAIVRGMEGTFTRRNDGEGLRNRSGNECHVLGGSGEGWTVFTNRGIG